MAEEPCACTHPIQRYQVLQSDTWKEAQLETKLLDWLLRKVCLADQSLNHSVGNALNCASLSDHASPPFQNILKGGKESLIPLNPPPPHHAESKHWPFYWKTHLQKDHHVSNA